MKKINKILLLWIIACVGVTASCSDFLNTSPTNSIPSDMITTLADARRVANGLYNRMKWDDLYGSTMLAMGELRADDIRSRTEVSGYTAIYQYNFATNVNNYSGTWTRLYNILLNANTLLNNVDGFPANGQADINIRNDIKGQALAVRAFCHFDIARMYGYPYQMDNGASLGAVIADGVIPQGEERHRATVKETYDFAIKDLNDALPLLSRARNHGRFNYWAAKALLARVYLYMGDYNNAFLHADEIITTVGSTYTLIPTADYVGSWARQNSSETLLELLVSIASNINDNNGVNAFFHIINHEGNFPGSAIVPTRALIDLLEEDPNDVRRQLIRVAAASGETWIAKFPGNSITPANNCMHNPVVLRLSEVYLIASEAALMKSAPDQGKANQYLNAIRKRANPNAPDITATVDEVLKERRKELMGEGHRFFDLSRLGRMIDRSVGNVLPINSTYVVVNPWDKTSFFRVVLPLSTAERQANPLAEQNPGYAQN
ncbi:MAG: RagB/SusD family nutrient uptake outer membrane protein [Bacteroidales bacterium]|nr:RagB/SusD family nutrient uptake outer membrane protein [Bacteroidales bacterium]